MKVFFLSWRGAFYVAVAVICASWTFSAFSQSLNQVTRAQNIADHFAAIKTMTGDFIQFSPKGKKTEGTFYLERPGKVRFIYKGVPVQIIADGEVVGVNNRALNTWNFSQLFQTPMKLLLGDKIDLSSGHLLALRETPGATTIILRDRSIGAGWIKMIFDSKSYALRQWSIIDQQNLETTVQIMNVRTGVKFADGMFTIPYKKAPIKKAPAPRNRN
ncbi:outer membrane lipoprotein carrier protein, LolA family [Bartonella australis AUST/NH1]|uniref:Outer membrane lipoprotein carrier protein, LolA family n=1 Tax=Bartonella australis (strain Aust/NH1) TaxID=1094489 RepID=M1P5E2_BARAA|nr:outer membrane lipoprotein carrier protein LolA [Bartonella australis]AGF75060.1 outer membrane lipoprotein carrier protein, LolA family [Bartonella australis AUST/NH1]